MDAIEQKLSAASEIEASLVLLPKDNSVQASKVKPAKLTVDYASTVFELVSKALELPKKLPEQGK